MAALTVTAMRAALASLGLSARRTPGGDIRVAFQGHGHEASACYETDWRAAYDTGVAMAVEAAKGAK
jgi:hypothetical protein